MIVSVIFDAFIQFNNKILSNLHFLSKVCDKIFKKEINTFI